MGLHNSKLARKLGLKLRAVPRAEVIAAHVVAGLELGDLKIEQGYKGGGLWTHFVDQGAGTAKRPTWKQWCREHVDADETSADHWIRTAEGAVILARRKRRRELVKLAEARPSRLTKAKRKTMLEGFAKLLEGETMTGLREIARKPARKAARGRLTKRERSELVAEVAAIVREEVRRALREEGGTK